MLYELESDLNDSKSRAYIINIILPESAVT